MRRKVIKNLYRERYDIPIDLMVRKPDNDITATVKTSESLIRVMEMEEKSINPSLIFFQKGLPERLIQAVIQKLHGDKSSQ